MAIKLASLKRVTAHKPPRILIYGPAGIGKTSLAAEFPDAAFVRVEDGIPASAEVFAFPVAGSFNTVIEQLGELYEAEDSGVRTVVIDSVTELQKLIFAETCARGDDSGNPKANIEDFGFGKGYVRAKAVMAEFLDAINMLRNDRGITVILIAHSVVSPYSDPETEAYDQFSIDLHKQLVGIVEREMDAILFMRSPVQAAKASEGAPKGGRVIGKGGRVRKTYTEGTPAFVAKNRYGLPTEFRYDLGKGYSQLAPFLPTHNKTETEAAGSPAELEAA
ncbi:ATP-binding protein [Acuticoccus sp. M5D2P5]|uniref:ATP-binding protein n=1 Tax=Acuticoccus kalidii TaxID=2910977 RepID=UPI001F1A1C78|nr:ATP-binding protein [Acuticoccus kalidii]MCF3934317.1 ATP-binding protein [Acuticoccus kalidii]